ncbi:hypothetical protein SLEP1_g9910 [Rubroshorea leprosula]|uniref:NAD-dependent epimerase/dehydratase domain-containing protein n=1 Tax=Rubroshorea leprosula TaxID=152421 RepID=A0AAV5IFP2_9ROSI|nr:hypothetical protein SLEP1_g9910 [Rubroshorea leprosula]
MEKNECRVCVTGGAGYIASELIRKLLDEGYTVHATLRNLGDASKVDILKSLPNANSRLLLFQANIYNPTEFQHAINGCQYVFHLASPLQHTEGYQFKNTTEAAVATAKTIAMSCVRSGVRRLIYAASIVSASPLKDDGSGYKDSMDETCWTPLSLSANFSDDHLAAYRDSKTLSEKEILSYGSSIEEGRGLEVVTLGIGLVGGDNTLLSYTPGSVALFISHLVDKVYGPHGYKALKYLEELGGKIPIVHVNDVCDAFIFCLNQASINGRFLCASSFVSSVEIAEYYQENHPEFPIKQEYLEGTKREVQWGSTRLMEKGFEYRCDTKMILDDCVRCARRTGYLQK